MAHSNTERVTIRRVRVAVLWFVTIALLVMIAAVGRVAAAGDWSGTLWGLTAIAWQAALIKFTIVHLDD